MGCAESPSLQVSLQHRGCEGRGTPSLPYFVQPRLLLIKQLAGLHGVLKVFHAFLTRTEKDRGRILVVLLMMRMMRLPERGEPYLVRTIDGEGM